MFIAHLPAGYICSKYAIPLFKKQGINSWYFIAAGIAGALTPDLDMLYFYFVDQRQHHHHTYWSHYPIVWFSLLCVSMVWLRWASVKQFAAISRDGVYAARGQESGAAIDRDGVYAARGQESGAVLALIFSLNGFVHMLLDTVVGDIWWFAPFVDKPFALFSVASVYKPWWLNFILHWTILLEIAICLWAFLLWRRKR